MPQMIGEVRLFAYNDVPAGWLECEGQYLEINRYPKLYMMIGARFGENGSYKFSLPDLREKAPFGLIYCIAVEGELPKLQSVEMPNPDKLVR